LAELFLLPLPPDPLISKLIRDGMGWFSCFLEAAITYSILSSISWTFSIIPSVPDFFQSM
jgi:hypothetical protein